MTSSYCSESFEEGIPCDSRQETLGYPIQVYQAQAKSIGEVHLGVGQSRFRVWIFEFEMSQLNFPSLDQNIRNMILPALDLRCLKSLKLGGRC